MNVLALSLFPRLGPSSRVRLYQFQECFHSLGILLDVLPFFEDQAYIDRFNFGRRLSKTQLTNAVASLYQRTRVAKLARGYDAIIVSKYLVPWTGILPELRVTRSATPLILDIDDNLFWRRDVRLLARRADWVVAGTDYLADLATLAGAAQTAVIPSTVPMPRPSDVQKPSRQGSRPLVGWIGTAAPFKRYVEPLLTELVDVCREQGGEIIINGPRSISSAVEAAGASFTEWSLDGEHDFLRRLDIGIMPLEADASAYGKCAYKAVQYSSYFVPCVANDLGAAPAVVLDGVTGYLVQGREPLLRSIKKLLEDKALRADMGFQARKHVEDKYSLESAATKWIDVFKSL